MGRKTSSSRSSPNSNSVWRLTNRITPSWSIPTKASGTASSSFSSFIVVEDIWFPLQLSWQGDDTQRHPMQYVDQGDDDPQAWPSRPSQPSQPEQHSLLALLDDPDRQPQNDAGQKYDDQNDDSSAHRDARLGPRGKPSPARIAIDVIMTPPLNRSRRGPVEASRSVFHHATRLHRNRALKPSPRIRGPGRPLGNLTPQKGAMSGC